MTDGDLWSETRLIARHLFSALVRFQRLGGLPAARRTVNAGRTEEQIAAIVLVGDHNWTKATACRAALVRAFGRAERIETHLGDVLDVRWWRKEPFLVTIREAGP